MSLCGVRSRVLPLNAKLTITCWRHSGGSSCIVFFYLVNGVLTALRFRMCVRFGRLRIREHILHPLEDVSREADIRRLPTVLASDLKYTRSNQTKK